MKYGIVAAYAVCMFAMSLLVAHNRERHLHYREEFFCSQHEIAAFKAGLEWSVAKRKEQADRIEFLEELILDRLLVDEEMRREFRAGRVAIVLPEKLHMPRQVGSQ